MSMRPVWFDPRMPDRRRCVLSALLVDAVAECPDRVFAVFADGSQWTYSEFAARARARAAGLRALGVGADDRVLVWLPNDAQALATWFAINLLGACFVPINTAFRGQILGHVLASSGARLMVAHASLIPRLTETNLGRLEKLIAVGSSASGVLGAVQVLSDDVLDQPDDGLELRDDRNAWDLQSIIFTSGTTGASKAVLSSYFHLYTAAEVLHGHMTSADRILVNAPLFHLGGTGAVSAALIHRGSIALIDGFKASAFWQIVRDTGSTMTSGLIGSMAPYLAKFGSDADRSGNTLRRTHFYPVSDETIGFAREFNFEYFSGFGMTELPLVLVTDLNPTVHGSCGRPRSGVECRLVDENDQEVPQGVAGELIVRTDHPWSFLSGYDANPEATARAWRNGWFHTGDLLRCDAEGNYYFIDRLKDAIRRRGENISSQEVEAVANQHAAVAEAAAVGVPSAYGEDEVLLVVVAKEERTISPDELFRFLRPRLPHFMLPRFIRVLPVLPKTPTDKIRKSVLKEAGVTTDTWDRERAGMVVARDDLVRDWSKGQA